jgi:hypothetical protein
VVEPLVEPQVLPVVVMAVRVVLMQLHILEPVVVAVVRLS